MTAHLVVFARSPVPGAVKTRLQARYTPQQAADIYRALVLDTLENARGASAARYVLAYTPADAGEEFRRLAGPGWDLCPQVEADLGGRMLEAARWSFDRGARRLAIIGSDAPNLPVEFIDRAFRLLGERDVVLGPTVDGGYGLIGLSRPLDAVFGGIDWGTERVFSQTVERVEAAGLTLGLVPPWYDVDTPGHLDFLVAHATALEHSGHPPTLHHTRRCVAAIAQGR